MLSCFERCCSTTVTLTTKQTWTSVYVWRVSRCLPADTSGSLQLQEGLRVSSLFVQVREHQARFSHQQAYRGKEGQESLTKVRDRKHQARVSHQQAYSRKEGPECITKDLDSGNLCAEKAVKSDHVKRVASSVAISIRAFWPRNAPSCELRTENSDHIVCHD